MSSARHGCMGLARPAHLVTVDSQTPDEVLYQQVKVEGCARTSLMRSRANPSSACNVRSTYRFQAPEKIVLENSGIIDPGELKSTSLVMATQLY